MKTPKLPTTDSIHALAEFWRTHDLTEFEQELEPVTEPVFVRAAPITLHLPPKEGRAVQRIARSKGLSKEELIRRWVKQNIAAERGT